MRVIIAFAFYFLYWFICFLFTGTDRKNLIGLRSYPDAVQEKVREKGLAKDMKKPSIPSILISNTLLFTVIFSVIGLIFRKALALESYLDAFLYFLVLGEGLGLFDLISLVEEHEAHTLLVHSGEGGIPESGETSGLVSPRHSPLRGSRSSYGSRGDSPLIQSLPSYRHTFREKTMPDFRTIRHGHNCTERRGTPHHASSSSIVHRFRHTMRILSDDSVIRNGSHT